MRSLQPASLGPGDVLLALGQFGGRTVRVGLPALPGLGVGRRQAGDFACVVARENREAHVGAGAEQFRVCHRHFEQHLIIDGLPVEARLRCDLPADQVVEDRLGDIDVVLHAGNLHRP